QGEFVRFDGVRSAPKPGRGRVPGILGGESRSPLERAADYRARRYGLHPAPRGAGGRVAVRGELPAAEGRDPEAFEIVVAPFTKRVTPDDLTRYRALGVGEVVIVATPPEEEGQVGAWVERQGQKWVAAAAALG